MLNRALIFIVFILSTVVLAAPTPATAPTAASGGTTQPAKPLSFSQWKAQQTLDAENRVARINNRMATLQRTGSADKTALRTLEGDLKSAVQSLEVAKEYTIEQYVASYVQTLATSKESLKELAEVLSATELAEVLYILAQAKPSASVRKKITPFVTGLNPPTRWAF